VKRILSFFVLTIFFATLLISLTGCTNQSLVKEKSAFPEKRSYDWVKHYTDTNGDVIYYRIEQKTNNVVQVWVKRVLTEEGEKEFIQDSKNNGLPTEGWTKLDHFTSLYEIDCSKKSGRVVSVVIYDKEGKAVYSVSFSEPNWEPTIPNSIGDTFRKKVCE